MPSGPAKVYRAGAVKPMRKRGEETAAGRYRAADRRGLQLKGTRSRPRAQAALAAGFAAVASSSNAAEMSRMLMTPIRL
jgi:hypothetical protein